MAAIASSMVKKRKNLMQAFFRSQLLSLPWVTKCMLPVPLVW
jgi:hypothetical protein